MVQHFVLCGCKFGSRLLSAVCLYVGGSIVQYKYLFSIGCLAFVSKYLHDFLNNWVASLCQLELFMINFACIYTSKFAMVIPPFEDYILRKEVWKTSKYTHKHPLL